MKLFTLSLVCILSVGLLACQRERGVEAGGEAGDTETYQPTPAPTTPGPGMTGETQMQELKGTLSRVDTTNNTIVVKGEDGMEQTMKFNDRTTVSGLEKEQAQRTGETIQSQMRTLAGKQGAEVTVHWKQEAGERMVTSINVTGEGEMK